MTEFEDVILDDQGDSSISDMMNCCGAVVLVAVSLCAIVLGVVIWG